MNSAATNNYMINNLDASAYYLAGKPDKRAIENVMHIVRGRNDVGRLGEECGYGTKTFYEFKRRPRQKPKSILNKLCAIASFDKSHEKLLSEEEILSTGGYIKKVYAEAMRRKVLRDAKSITEHSGKEMPAESSADGANRLSRQDLKNIKESQQYRKKAVPEKKVVDLAKYLEEKTNDELQRAERYLDFLDEISRFSEKLSQRETRQISRRLQKIFADEDALRMIHEFNCSSELEAKQNQEHSEKYYKGNDPDRVPEWKNGTKDMFRVLQDLLTTY